MCNMQAWLITAIQRLGVISVLYLAYRHVIDGHGEGEAADIQRQLPGYGVQVIITVSVHLHPGWGVVLLCNHSNQV